MNLVSSAIRIGMDLSDIILDKSFIQGVSKRALQI
jgi:hypothetical protein